MSAAVLSQPARAPDLAAAPARLSIRGLNKSYGDVVALRDVNIDVRAGEFFALLGPSGCGKTTMLRAIAGIVETGSGEIRLGAADISQKPIYARDTALVFQNYALFPHLSVYENVAFGLKMRKRPAAEIKARVMEALELVRLPDLARRLPRELSGGQQQRIALARAMVVRPALLLLDEPLSNLDARLREEMRSEIKRLQQTLGVTTILVTHDIEEALVVADRLSVMRHGRVEQIGAPAEIYETPRTRFVAEFVGHANVLGARVAKSGRDLVLDNGLTVAVGVRADNRANGDAVCMIAPAERIRLAGDADGLENRYEAIVENVAYLGGFRQLTLDLNGARVITRQQNLAGGNWRAGDRIIAGWRAGDVIIAAENA